MKTKKMKTKFYGLIVLSFVLMSALICWPLRGMAAEEKILKFGSIEPISGPAALWGIAMTQGTILAAEDFNAKGGLKVGDTIYKIKVLEEDDKYTGTGALSAATKLIYQEGVRFITGPLGSAGTQAVQPISEKEKCVIMTNSYADVLDKSKLYTFRIGPHTIQGDAGCFKAANTKYPGRVKKVAVVTVNDATGWGCAKGVKAISKALGWEVVAEEFYERGLTDFHPLLARVLAKKPDLIDTNGTPSIEGAMIVAQSYEMGYRGIQTGMNIMPKLQAEKGGPGIVGAIGFFGVDYDMPWITKGQKELYEKYRAKWPGQNMLYQVEEAYSGTKGVLSAIEKAGTLDSPTVLKVLENLIWDVPVGKAEWLDFDGFGYKGIKRQIGMPHPITELTKEGKLNLIMMVDLAKIVQEMGIKIEGR